MPSPRDKSPAAGVIPPRLLAVPCFRSPSLGFDGGDLDKCTHTHAYTRKYRITVYYSQNYITHIYTYIHIDLLLKNNI